MPILDTQEHFNLLVEKADWYATHIETGPDTADYDTAYASLLAAIGNLEELGYGYTGAEQPQVSVRQGKGKTTKLRNGPANEEPEDDEPEEVPPIKKYRSAQVQEREGGKVRKLPRNGRG